MSADTGVDSIDSSGVDTSVAVVVDSDSDSVSGGADVVGDCGVDDVVADSVEDNISSLESDLDEDNVGVDSDGSSVGSVSLLGASVNDGKNDVLSAARENSFSALQELIDGYAAGSIVVLPHSYTYDDSFDKNFTEGVVINKSLIIDGGSSRFVVNGAKKARCFNVSSSDVTFQNMVIRSGRLPLNNKTDTISHSGGCIYFKNAKNINLINCNIKITQLQYTHDLSGYDNAYGAGVYATNANNFNVINCVFDRDQTGWMCSEAAGLYFSGTSYYVLFKDSNFTTMFSYGNGGAIRTANVHNLSIIHCKFDNSRSGNNLNTFIMFNAATNITIANNTFDYIQTYVGLIYFNNYAKNITIYNNTFTRIVGGHEALLYLREYNHENIYVGHNNLNDVYAAGYRVFMCHAASAATNITFEFNTLNNVRVAASIGMLEFFPNWKSVSILNNTFIGCYADRDYGLIYTLAPTKIINNTFIDYRFSSTNDAYYGRGVAIHATNKVLIENNTFTTGYLSGTLNRVEGVIYISPTGSANITNNSFRDNNITRSYSGHTGVIHNEGNNTIIKENSFYDNYCTDAQGGIIYNSGNYVQIYNNNVTGASAGTGGVVYNTGSNVNIYNINATDVQASDAGGFYILGDNVNVSFSYFENVHADKDYGVIYCDSPKSNIYNNTYITVYEASRGAVALNNNISLFNESFIHAYATNGYAGAILLIGDYNIVGNITINDSSAFNGGAIYNMGKYNNLTNTLINNSVASSHGGAVYSEGSYLNISDLNVYNTNAVLDGGAVYNTATYNYINDATFENVSAGRNGGVIFWSGDNGNMSKITIINAHADSVGGAIYLSGNNVNMYDWTVNNVYSSSGGAVYCLGSYCGLYDSKFYDIRATGDGGAIFWTGSNANLTNIIFDKINSTANGGAIYGTATDSSFNELSFNDINATENGGVLYWAGARSHLYDINITNANSFTGSGGALYWSGDRSSIRKARIENVSSEVNAALYWTGLESNMSDAVFINCKAKDQGGAVYWTGSTSELYNSTFINNSASNGGAVFWNSADSKLYNSTFKYNNATNDGGAVYWMGNDAQLSNLTCINNTAGFKGGAINLIGNSPEFYNLTCINNSAGVDGGAVIIDSSKAILINSSFTNNTAVSGGGALYWSGSDGVLTNVNFTNNIAGVGGALYWASNNANVSFVNFTGNSAVTGGALYMGGLNGSSVVNATFIDNSANGTGGAIYWSSSNGQLLDSSFYGSSARDGGAIYWSGDTAYLDNLEFDKVSANSTGGIVYVSASKVVVSNSSFVNSKANSGGAVYWLGSEGILFNASFENNTAVYNGGAVYWMGSNATISAVNFTNNNASIDGGALYIVSYGANLTNINFFNNSASNYGGGMYWGGNGNTSDAVFKFNDAHSGSAIYNSGILDLSNCVVLNNTADISSIEIITSQSNTMLDISVVLHGLDNFLNGIWTTSDSIRVKNVTYFGIDGEMTSNTTDWDTPVSGVSENKLYYDSRLPNIGVNVSCSREGVVYSSGGNTSILGEFNTSFSKLTLGDGNFNVTAVHYGDDYYFTFSNSTEEGIGVIYPTFNVRLTKDEVYYGGVSTIRVLAVGIDGKGESFPVSGLADIYLDNGDFLMTIPIDEATAFVDVILPENCTVEDSPHRIFGYFHNGTDEAGHDIGSVYSDYFYFNVVRNYMPTIVNITTDNPTYYVDEEFNITITGPSSYNGPIEVVAGYYSNLTQLINGSRDLPVVYHEAGLVKVMIYVQGDLNYLPSVAYYEFNIIKRDLAMSFANVSGTSLGNIFVGDDAIFVINLGANDTTNKVLVSVGGVDYTFPVVDSVVVANISGLSSGVYPVYARYIGDNKYNSVNTDTYMFTVNKVDIESISVVAEGEEVLVGDDVILNIIVNSTNSSLYPFNDAVSVSIAGKSYNVSIVNNTGKLIVSDLVSGAYDVMVAYDGGSQFNSKSVGVPNVVGVYKINTHIVVNPMVNNIMVHDEALFEVSVIADKYVVNGSISVNVNDNPFVVVPVVEGKAIVNISGLKAGLYYVDIFYNGDYQFVNSLEYVDVVVSKYNINNIVLKLSNETIYVGQDTILNITADSNPFKVNGIANVEVDGKYYNVSLTNGTGSFKISGLAYNDNPYVISVTYAGDDTFNSYGNVATIDVRVNKVDIKNITVTPAEHTISVGDDALFNVEINSVLPEYVVNGYVTVNVNNVNYTVPIADGSGSLKVSNLLAGDYPVLVSYGGDDTFNSFNYSTNVSYVCVAKKPTNISMNNVTIDVGNVAVIVAHINNSLASGKVTFMVDGVEYTESILNGVSTLKVYGIYSNSTITATYSGDDMFSDSNCTASLIVNKLSNSISISVYDIVSGGNENVVIVLPSDASGTVEVKFNNTILNSDEYSITNNVITFNRTILPVGEYTVNASLFNDPKYNDISASSSFNVTKVIDYPISLTACDVIVGESSVVKMTLPDDANGKIRINGFDYNVSEARSGIDLSKMYDAGLYTVVAEYIGDSRFGDTSVTGYYRVYKAGSNVSISMEDVFFVGEDIHFTVNTVNSTGRISVIINDKVYYPSNSSGYPIGSLESGTYNVIVKLDADSNYNASSTSKIIQVVKNPVTISLRNIDSPVNVGDSFAITAEFNNSVSGTVIFTIGGVNHTANVVGNSVSYIYTATQNGTFEVTAFYSGNDKFCANTTASSKSFEVVKIPTTLFVSAYPIYVGEDAYINVEVRSNEATGNVRVVVNNKSYAVSLVSGKGSVVVSGLTNTSTIEAYYDGDYKYDSSSNVSSIVVVNKVDVSFIDVTANSSLIHVGENVALVINLVPSVDGYLVNGLVNVSVGGNVYNVSIVDNCGSLVVRDLSYGSHAVNVSYAGNDVFNPRNRDYACVINVVKVPVNIGVDPAVVNISVGEVACLNVTLDADVDGYSVNGVVSVNVAGDIYNVSVVNGKGYLAVYDLASGFYDVSIVYDGDSVFNFNNAMHCASINVSKLSTTIDMNDVNISVGSVAVFTASFDTSDVTGSVIFVVDGVEYSSAIVNGVAQVMVYGLDSSANNTIVTAKYSGDNRFLNTTAYCNLWVNKLDDGSASVTVYDIVAGMSENAVIVLPVDITNGTVVVRFNGAPLKSYEYDINNNVITFNRTINVAGDYTVDVSVVGDAKYDNIDASGSFHVSPKDDYNIVVNVDDVVLGDSPVVTVVLPDDAVNGVVVIDGVEYGVKDASRGVRLPAVGSAGVHDVNVTYADSKYNNKTVVYSYNVLRAGSSVYLNIGDVFYVGDTIQFNVTAVNSTGDIHVIINNREFSPFNATNYTIDGGLAYGTYNVIVHLDGDDNYESSETSKVINVIKKPVSIALDDIISPVNVDDEVLITARFSDNVTGNVIFTVNNVNYTVEVMGDRVGYIYVPVTNGTYTVTGYYSGSDKFNANSTRFSKSFAVNKFNTTLIIRADSINIGEDAFVTVEVNSAEATGSVTVNVNGRSYVVVLNNGSGSVVVPGLIKNTTVSAFYSGDRKYDSADADSIIVVNKVDISSISISPSSQEILVGKNATLDITLTPAFSGYSVNGWVNVSVDDNSFKVPIIDNSGHLIVSGLAAGVHSVNVDYYGDSTFNPNSRFFDSVILVNKLPVTLEVTPDTTEIYVNQYATFNVSVKASEHGYVVDGYVTVNVGDTSFNVSISEGYGKFDVHGLAYGTHAVTVSYAGDDTYKPSSPVEVTVNVIKVPVNVDVAPLVQSISVGDNALLNITITPTIANYTVNGNAIVTVDGVGEFNVSIANGSGYVTFYDLVNATHNVHVYYAGDDVFESFTFDDTVTVLVNKIPTEINMSDVSLNVGDDAVIIAVVNVTDVTGNVTFIVNNKEYTVGIINGVARLNVTGLNTSANKTIVAKYSGDYKYINSTTTAQLDISRVYGNASIVVYNITAGETETVIINLPSDVTNGTITVKFNDENVSDYVVSNNVISFNRTLQSSGNYSVSVSVNDDCKYYNFNNYTMFTVFKVAPENYIIHIDVNNTEVFKEIPVTVNLPDDANGTLSIVVDNDTIINDVSVDDGVATRILGNLSSGNHTITVNYGNEKYDDKTVTVDVFVSKIASSINITNPVDPRVAHDIIINVTPEARSNGDITVTINNKTYNVTDRSFVNASDLLEGEYTVVAVLAEDDNFFESTNTSVFVVKRNPVSMTLNDVAGEVRVDHSIILHVDLNETVTGSVIFNINGENFTVNITESDIAEYNWTPTVDTVVTIFAQYLGNDTYYPNSTNAIVFDVYKNSITFANITVEDIMVDDIEHIIVTLNESDATGIITINVNGSSYEATIADGSAAFNVSGIPAGTYKVIASYGGDFKYLATNSISDEFTVFKYDCPVIITADDIMVLDDALIIVNVSSEASGHIFITVDNRSVYLPVVDGSVSWIVPDLSAGVYEVVAEYSGDYKYLSNSSVGTLNVFKYNSTFDIIRDDAGWTGEDINMSVKLSDDATGNVTLNVNGTEYVLPVSDGRVDFTIPMLDAGDYEVNVIYSGDYKYADAFDSFNFTVNSNYPIINSDNLVKYYKGSERLYINLTNVRGDKLAGETVYITVNGITYARVTNDDGICSVPINLVSGDYTVDIVYNTSSLYDPVTEVVNVTVLPTVHGDDLVKVFGNASQYWARFTDSEGNALAGTSVRFNINGVFYTRTTDGDGWAKLNINLPAGEYIITAYNPVTDEKYSNNITVLPRIVENYDLVKVYRSSDKFSVRVVGDDANPVGAGVKVEFNINGVFYTRSTDADGYARLNINLPPGEYIITTYYEGCAVSNKITVLPEE